MTDQQDREGGIAFEYVAGTLTVQEREAYEILLSSSKEEQANVAFWEEQLQVLNAEEAMLAPAADTWERIQNHISPQQAEEKAPFSWSSVLQWAMPTMAAVVLMVVMIGYQAPGNDPVSTAPNTDYIAVLTDENGNAVLTALTTVDDNRMWLKWEPSDIEDDSDLQLWAVSKRDGEVRPIAVFKDTSGEELALTEATFRLVTDSSFLLLTKEEPGGSALDEPSEDLIAKGVCVRFTKEQSAS